MPDLNLAAGWYIALPSHALRKKPKQLELFGRPLVAWRDREGRPVIMPLHCRHMGASLALGRVVDGCIECRFHRWRFAPDGHCVAAPGLERIPLAVVEATYPLVERHGFVWIWYGSEEPMFPLPEFPPLDGDRGSYFGYRFCVSTTGSVRRVLENAFDYQHFTTLHGLKTDEPLQQIVFSHPDETRKNGPSIAANAWVGAAIECPKLKSHAILKALGLHAESFYLLVDGWPGGQRITFFADGKELYRELLGVTPVRAGKTVMRGWSMVKRTGSFLRDLAFYVAFFFEHRAGTKQDLSLYEDAREDKARVHVKYDRGIIKFREFYQLWVRRVVA